MAAASDCIIHIVVRELLCLVLSSTLPTLSINHILYYTSAPRLLRQSLFFLLQLQNVLLGLLNLLIHRFQTSCKSVQLLGLRL